MSSSKRVTLNFGAVLVGRVVQAVYAYVTIPLLLHYWGGERLATWLVISAVPTWMSMSDLGFGSVTSNEMVLRAARGDTAGATKSLHTALCVLGGLIAIAFVMLSTAAWAIDWSARLDIHNAGAHELGLTMFLLGAAVLLGLPVELGRGMLRSEGRMVDASLWSSIKPVFDLVATCVALHAGVAMTGLAATLAISQGFYTGLFMFLANRACSRVKIGWKQCDQNQIITCFKKGVAFSLFPLSNALVLQGSLLAVNAALGAQAVLIFGTIRTLSRVGYQMVTLVYSSVLPEMGRLLGAQDLVRARRLHRTAVATTIVSTLAAVVFLGLFGPWLYGIWTAHKIEINRALLVVLGVGAMTTGLWVTSSVVLTAANRHERLALFNLFMAACSVPICYFMCKASGLTAGSATSILTDLVLILYVWRGALQLTGDDWRSFATGVLKSGDEGLAMLKAKLPFARSVS